MSGAGHTPGPWSTTFARDLPNDPRFDIIAYGARPFPSASPPVRTVAENVSQPDAPLIAAAPALLAALREAFFQFEHNGDEAPEDKAVLDRMAAALAKAEGREP